MAAKRVVTEVGDIYAINDKPGYYLQLIAIDIANMSSDAVAVFDDRNVTDDHLQFYTHTNVLQGMSEGLWNKLGKVDVRIPTEKLAYKNYIEIDDEMAEFLKKEELPGLHTSHWLVWNLGDTDMQAVALEEGKNIVAEDGGIYPAKDIVYRIVHGKSEFITGSTNNP